MAELVKDPVCGMEIDPETAAGQSEYEGTTYYFCAEGCKQEFDADPKKFLGGGETPAAEMKAEEPAAAPAAGMEEKPAKRWWEFWKS
jgi:Cu+-exporting ATPase